ncbi:MAG: hypothetical protein WCC60_19855, partial [Ilumatobacteraceae bacterium]
SDRQIVTATKIELGQGPERELLERIITHCRQTLYFEDRTVTAVVMPVAVCLRTSTDGGVVIGEGSAQVLKSVASLLKAKTGARNVAFDRRLFEGRALHGASTPSLRDLLLQIEAEVDPPEGGPKPWDLCSLREPVWQMVYFLGVVVTAPDQVLLIDTEAMQRGLVQWRRKGAEAVLSCNQIFFDREVSAEGVCEGFWTLDCGVRKGEDLQRSYHLESLIARLEPGVGGVQFRYLNDWRDGHIRLLVTCNHLTVEHRWRLLVGEKVDGFSGALDRAIALHLGGVNDVDKCELDLYDYEALVRQKGLSWTSSAARAGADASNPATPAPAPAPAPTVGPLRMVLDPPQRS